MTDQLHFHFSLSCIGEGNGNPLQCSCLENPRDGGAWWAAVYEVAQSRIRLKRLSSSSYCKEQDKSEWDKLQLLVLWVRTFWDYVTYVIQTSQGASWVRGRRSRRLCKILTFPLQEHWSGLPFPSQGDLPDPGIKPVPPAFFTAELPGN